MIIFLALESLISALVFIYRRPKHISNYLISIWFIINGLNFINIFLFSNGLSDYVKSSFIPYTLLNGPLCYFYVKTLITINFKFHWKHLLHLIPFFITNIFQSIVFNQTIMPWFYFGENLSIKFLILTSIIIISLFSYMVAVIILLDRHKKNLKNYFSHESQIKTMNWVYYVAAIINIGYIIKYFGPMLHIVTSIERNLFWFNEFNLGMLGFILLVFGLWQPPIFIEKPINQEEKNEISKEHQLGTKYTRSGLSKEQSIMIAQTIKKYILADKPFLNPDYNLELMARDLNITRQNLSQVINDELGKNFYQLINEFRVVEFKKYLNDPKMEHINFLGLAYEAGFNSKSSFYRMFKEITGETPTEYRDRIRTTNYNSNFGDGMNQAITL